MDIPPFPNAPVREEVLPAEAADPVLRFRGIPDIMAALPDSQQRDEIRRGILEEGVHPVGLRLLLCRPLPRVLTAERRGDDENLRQTFFLIGFKNHPGDPWVDRKPGHDPPPLRQPPGIALSPRFICLPFDRP